MAHELKSLECVNDRNDCFVNAFGVGMSAAGAKIAWWASIQTSLDTKALALTLECCLD